MPVSLAGEWLQQIFLPQLGNGLHLLNSNLHIKVKGDKMLFHSSRIVLWLIASAIVIYKIRVTKIVRKKLVSLLLVALCLILVSVSGMYPVENLFINFKSSESVFNYANFCEVNDILYGKESCMVIYTNQNNSGWHYIIPKTEKGYKIPNYFATKKVANKFDKNGNFDVYNVLGTQDYYIVGTILSNTSEQNIVDSQNHPVENIMIDMGNTETKTVILYSYVENFNKDYYLIMNGIKTTIAE